MNPDLSEKLVAIENRYLPIIKILETNALYKSLYKGFISIQSKFTDDSPILFLGINPGEGAFRELNAKEPTIPNFPRRTISDPIYLKNLTLDWSKKGVARGESINKKWHAYDWHDQTKKARNPFPARMMDLLYSCTDKLHSHKKYQRKELIDIMENDMQNKVIYTNICPIATKSVKELNQIFNLLSKEKSIGELIGTKTKVTPAMVSNFFRQRAIDLIIATNPKVIVLLGHSAYKNLTLLEDYKGIKVFSNEVQLRKSDTAKYKTISFTRLGNWSPLIDDISIAMLKH